MMARYTRAGRARPQCGVLELASWYLIRVTGVALVGYVIAALGYSTIYRATVMLALWQLGMESLQLSGLSVLDRVNATGTPASALGEGLADALNEGGS